MTASATKSSSTTRPTKNVDRLALIRAKAEERKAAKAEREAVTAKLAAKDEAEDAAALAQCHVILNRMSERGAVARAQREIPPVRKRGRAIRLAPVTARDAEVETGTASVRNPYDPSSFITTTVNRKVDLLATERSAGRITEAQFLVGRTLQMLWEKQLGVRSGGAWDSTTSNVGPGQLAVSHAFTIEDVRMLGRIETARLVKASNERAARVIGEAGVHFLRAILAEGHSFKSYAEARGRAADWRAISDITRRFRWLLEELTETQHTARAPGARPIRDGYATQADGLAERLLRSAAFAVAQEEASVTSGRGQRGVP